MGASSQQEIQKIKKKTQDAWSEIAIATTFDHIYSDTNYNNSLEDVLSNIFIQAGTESYTFWGAGYITTSSKDLCFTIPVNKIINDKTISSISITSCELRQGENYLFSSSDSLQSLRLTTYISSTGIRCVLHKTQNNTDVAFPNATNNDTVGINITISVTWA